MPPEICVSKRKLLSILLSIVRGVKSLYIWDSKRKLSLQEANVFTVLNLLTGSLSDVRKYRVP